MLRANYYTMINISLTSIISIIIETFIFIQLAKITYNMTADAADTAAQNQTTPLFITNHHNHLISNNNSVSNDTVAIYDEKPRNDDELISFVTKVFCQLYSNPVYMYVDHEMQFSRIVEDMMISVHDCLRSTFFVKRINYSSPYDDQQLNTNNVLNFTLFLIINQLSDDLQNQFSFISKFTGNKNQKKYILFINSTQNSTQNKFRLLFRQFHHKLIYNIIVVARTETSDYDVMTYNPFAMFNYVEYFKRNETRLAKLFYNKIFRNKYERIRIKIILFKEQSRMIFDETKKIITGIDGLVMRTIMSNMNAEYEIRTPRDNNTYGALINGMTYGSLKDIQEWYGDVSFNSRYMRPDDYLRIVEPSVVLGRDDLCLLVPNSGNQSNVGNLLHSFSHLIWTLIVLMIIFVSTIMFLTQKLTRHWKKVEIKNVLLTVFRLNLNQSVRKTPKKFQMRIVFIAWLLYCILITNSFIANLTSVLILEREREQIDSLDQLANSGLEVLSPLRYKNDLIRNLNMLKPTHVQIAKRTKVVDESIMQALIANQSLQYAYLEKDHVIKYILDMRSHLVRGRRIYHEMQQCPVPGIITYITPIGSPYLDRINFLVSQIFESGLYNWWNKNLENERKARKNRRFIKNRENSQPFKNLSLNHLQLMFYLLGVGLTLSTIVFFVELQIIRRAWKKCKFKWLHDDVVTMLTKIIKKKIVQPNKKK